MVTSSPPPIACSLVGDSYADRLAWIADLHARALIAGRREGRSLILTYRPDAAGDVEELVRREQDCCAFLSFDVARHDSGIVLTITAPADAEAMLDDVFAPFEQASACSCNTPSEAKCAPPNRSRKGAALVAAGFSTVALACGVCCAVPFLVPAAAAGAIGAVVTFSAGFYGIASALAVLAVIMAWGRIALRRGRAVTSTELAITTGATILLIAALSWPQIERCIIG